MKVAIVHDWLVSFGGAERVLAEMLSLYPGADIFTLVNFMDAEDAGFLQSHRIETSFIQKLPFAKKHYRNYLPLMPFAIEQFDLSGYDLVISSSHAVAKGVITGPAQKHICMCYSPIRYAWDLQHQYLKESNLDKGFKGFLAKTLLFFIRGWDYRTANGVDNFIAISDFIRKRIWKVYRRDSEIIYPPVNLEFFTPDADTEKGDYFFTASRMVPYKKIDLIVETFKNLPDKKLVVIGDGPDYDKIAKLAKNSNNISLLGYQNHEVLRQHLQQAKAFVFAAEEDFGIAPIEAQACGTPVIAFGKGGALETIIENKTGLFFHEQNCDSLAKALETLEKNNFDSDACRKNAERFSSEHFRKQLSALVDEKTQTQGKN